MASPGLAAQRGTRLPGACPLFFAFLLLFDGSPAHPADNAYLAGLQETAARSRLQDDRYWDVLLHYKAARGGRKSLVDDPKFFLSPDGKRNPAAELSATLDAFFDDSLSPPARCRFPARYGWLKETLPIDPARLPTPACPELDNVLRQIDPKAVAMIFASAHMNAPASMFGHTFLRVDSAYESPLLSFAVNYAATIDRSDSGISYAFKGIFGSYPGFYSLLPYYEKVREYASMEQRDLWEYRLNLTEPEVRRMSLHALEMRDIYSDYYFLDENCSYDLLFLLEAARPSARLTDRNRGFFVTPIDTLRSVLAEGMVDSTVFRPSAARKIRQKAADAGREDTALARSLALGEAEPAAVMEGPLPDPDKARTLDIASDFTQYLYLKEEIPKDVYQKRYLGILTARSGVGGPPPGYSPVPVPPPPQSGHPTSRVALSAGSRDGDPFLEFAYRPAYHSMDDPAEGFGEGAQIVFSEAAARWYPREGRIRLQEWDLIDIVSISPRDTLFRPVSWKVQTGFTTREFPGDVESLLYALNPGGGFAWKVFPLGLLYFLAETELDFSDRYDHWYTVSLGGSVGILRQAFDRWGVLARIRYVYGVLGDTERGRRFTASLTVPCRVSRNQSIVLEGTAADTPGVRTGTLRLSWYYYF